MKRSVVSTLAAVAVFGALGFGLYRFFDVFFSFAGKWEGKVRSAAPSPDGRYVAEVSDWNGGATTGLQTRIALRPSTARDTVTGVTRSEGTVAVLFGSPQVTVRWLGPQQLAIKSEPPSFKEHQEAWRDVRISYQAPK